MRYKLVPPVRDVETLDSVWTRLPSRPTPETDCCARIAGGTTALDRDEARTWLVFLQALGCVETSDGAFYRSKRPSTHGDLGKEFERHVLGVSEIRALLEESPETVAPEEIEHRLDDAIVDRLDRTDDPSAYVARLLGWGVELGLFGETAGQSDTSPD